LKFTIKLSINLSVNLCNFCHTYAGLLYINH